MIPNDQSGFLEQIQTAVKPLIAGGEFHLEPISLEYYDGDVRVELRSSQMDIIFLNTMRINTRVDCIFKVHSIKKVFFSKYLYPALNIPVTINNGDFIMNYANPITKDNPDKYYVEIDYLLQKSGLIRELNRQCIAIHENLSEIRTLLNSDNIDETLVLYIAELKRHGNSEEWLYVKI